MSEFNRLLTFFGIFQKKKKKRMYRYFFYLPQFWRGRKGSMYLNDDKKVPTKYTRIYRYLEGGGNVRQSKIVFPMNVTVLLPGQRHFKQPSRGFICTHFSVCLCVPCPLHEPPFGCTVAPFIGTLCTVRTQHPKY